MTTLNRLKSIIQILDSCDPKDFAYLFVKHKMEFFRDYQNGYIFSTRFGIDFFHEAKDWILNRKDFINSNSEYDKNFNAWLKTVRTEK